MLARKAAAEYVQKHLAGLTAFSTTREATASASAPLIATHSGCFHCDEAMACGMLRHVTPYHTATIVRTRDGDDIDRCDVAVDVGGVFDPSKNRYDHHQPTFHGTMTTTKMEYQTRLSSAGLVYQRFGRGIIQEFVKYMLTSAERATLQEMTGWGADKTQLTDEETDVMFDVVYKNFVQQVDGIDNGVDPYRIDGGEETTATLHRNYMETTNLSARVFALQPWWNEPGGDAEAVVNKSFISAVEITTLEFFYAIAYYAFSWLPARRIVQDAFLGAPRVHASGAIVELERFCPWKEHLPNLETENGCAGRSLYVLYSDGKGWRVQAVPTEHSQFVSRKPLPWKGLRNEELSDASGIPGGVFVHVTGFIGGNQTRDGALAMAIKAVEAPEDSEAPKKRDRPDA